MLSNGPTFSFWGHFYTELQAICCSSFCCSQRNSTGAANFKRSVFEKIVYRHESTYAPQKVFSEKNTTRGEELRTTGVIDHVCVELQGLE